MKFIATDNRVNVVEDTECTMLVGVTVQQHKRMITLNQWGATWIFEADDYYNSYCVMAHGWQPAIITDEEYRTLIDCGYLFISRERHQELWNAIYGMRPPKR